MTLGVHWVCITRTFATFLAHVTRTVEPSRIGHAGLDGRTWYRTREKPQMRGATVLAGSGTIGGEWTA